MYLPHPSQKSEQSKQVRTMFQAEEFEEEKWVTTVGHAAQHLPPHAAVRAVLCREL